jgi:signal transduction histidine kinase
MTKQKVQTDFNWLSWLMPRPIDWMATLLYLGVLGVYTHLVSTNSISIEYPWLGGTVVVFTVLVLMALDRLEYWRYGEKLSWQISASFLFLRLILIVGASFSDGLGFLPLDTLLVLVILFVFFFLAGGSYGLSGQAWTMYLLGRFGERNRPPSIAHNEPDIFFFMSFALGIVFIFSIAFLVRQERTSRLQAETLLTELRGSHRQLQAYAEQVAELAATEERNRLAREIHDSLGHYMTVINVQLEKAIAFRNRSPTEADQAVQDAKHLAREALKDIRRSVSTLRNTPEPFSLSQSLNKLVNNMGSDQFFIELEIEGSEDGYSKQSLLTLYRAAQEGLTNIQKHARASHATVRVQLEAQQARLYIEDDGQGFDPVILEDEKNGGHYGLQGVRERLELIRGSLKLDSDPTQGTTLAITVPKNPLVLVNGQVS